MSTSRLTNSTWTTRNGNSAYSPLFPWLFRTIVISRLRTRFYSVCRLKASGEQVEDRIVEVYWETSHERWRMMRFRDDKPNGNFKTVVENIIQSIIDGVEKEDVRKSSLLHPFSCIPSMKTQSRLSTPKFYSNLHLRDSPFLPRILNLAPCAIQRHPICVEGTTSPAPSGRPASTGPASATSATAPTAALPPARRAPSRRR